MPLRARLLLLLGVLLVALGACVSPTLPLPPPSDPVVEGPDADGLVTLTGNAPPDSLVIGRNLSVDQPGEPPPSSTFETEDDGVYVLRMRAAVGDTIVVFYINGGQLSPNIIVDVRAPPGASDAGSADAGP